MSGCIELEYGTRCFSVDVEFNCRKHLTITVHPDCTIKARAPEGIDLAEIERRLHRRKGWIARQVSYFEQFQPAATERKYVSGETHYYLGRQYRLRISRGPIPRVHLRGRFFQMELPELDDRGKAKLLLRQWYGDRAQTQFAKRIDRFWHLISNSIDRKPTFRLRALKRRWGSYSSNGIMSFNSELIRLPANCIDYVIVHELCHAVYADHDKKYYQLLSSVLPDWETRKDKLEKSGSIITS